MIVGVIGAGRIGAVHGSLLAAIPSIERVLIADLEEGRATALASQLPRAQTSNIDEVFSVADGVVIATSTDAHASLLQRAAAEGVTAFCQKPITLDLKSSQETVRVLESSGIKVQMGFQRRFDPAMRSIRDQIRRGDLGRVYLVRSQTHDPEPPPLGYIPLSGGIFKDCLIHDIDIVRYVTGDEIGRVWATGSVVGHPEIGRLGDVATAAVTAETAGGTIVQLSGLRHDPLGYDVRLEVFGSADSMAAGFGVRTPIGRAEPDEQPAANPIRTWFDRFETAYRLEMEAFVGVIAGDEEPESTPRDAEIALQVATACDMSLTEGRAVLVEEAA